MPIFVPFGRKNRAFEKPLPGFMLTSQALPNIRDTSEFPPIINHG